MHRKYLVLSEAFKNIFIKWIHSIVSVKMLMWVDARRVALLALCLVACSEGSARKVDQIRLPSHTRVKYMPADHKKVTIEEKT